MASTSADHIASASGGQSFEPQRQCNFTIQIADLGSEAELTVQSVNFPKLEASKEQIEFQNSRRNYAGKGTFGDITFEVFDVVGQGIGDKLFDWYKKVYDPDSGAVGLASTYKKDGTLILHGPDGGGEKDWRLEGIWPTSVDMGEGDMGSAGPVRISCTLAVDKISK